MARRRSNPFASQKDVRALLAENLRELYDLYARPFEKGGRPVPGCPWPAQVRRLVAGEPLDVPAWKILKWLEPLKPHPDAWLRVEPDGTVRPLDG